uniref:Putative ovule protein n=1 Tax=Solanum chacoense TaxID=4108 RepID=A0A0V0H6I3_SOLCH
MECFGELWAIFRLKSGGLRLDRDLKGLRRSFTLLLLAGFTMPFDALAGGALAGLVRRNSSACCSDKGEVAGRSCCFCSPSLAGCCRLEPAC